MVDSKSIVIILRKGSSPFIYIFRCDGMVDMIDLKSIVIILRKGSSPFIVKMVYIKKSF